MFSNMVLALPYTWKVSRYFRYFTSCGSDSLIVTVPKFTERTRPTASGEGKSLSVRFHKVTFSQYIMFSLKLKAMSDCRRSWMVWIAKESPARSSVITGEAACVTRIGVIVISSSAFNPSFKGSKLILAWRSIHSGFIFHSKRTLYVFGRALSILNTGSFFFSTQSQSFSLLSSSGWSAFGCFSVSHS